MASLLARTTPIRAALTFGCAIAALLLIAAAVLPTPVWRDAIVHSTSWGPDDDRDLRYIRILCAGFALVAILLSTVFGWNLLLKERFKEPTGSRMYRGILIALLLSSGYFIARLFIVFRDSVRITGPKTPFSNWGEFLGKQWAVPFQPFTERDYFTSMFLALAGMICLLMVVLRHKGLVRMRWQDFPRILWGLLAFGFLWASLDELVMIHEFLGPNLPIIRSTTITKYPDDLIILAYFVCGIAVLVRYWKYLIARKSAFAILLVGVFLHGVAAFNGLPWFDFNEESFEMYAGLSYLVSVFWYAFCEVENSLDHYHSLRKHPS